MDSYAIALAVPAFFLLIAIEALIAQRRGDLRYRFHDAVTSLSCGIGQQALNVFFVFAKIGGYALVWERFRVATVSSKSVVAWVVLLFAVDLGYWVYHWASHRVNFFWATHVVHHQSEEYNLSTALRQSWFTGLTSWIFYLPLAVIGFPPLMFLAMHTINTLYQFWIHTRLVGRLGVLEAVLNTPSHHRVHHGTDPRYIDKNYAGIFIFWDRLFGTFAKEEGEPVYGTVTPLASWNPLWANVEPFVKLAKLAKKTRRWQDKIAIWFMPPERLPADLGGVCAIPEVSRATQKKYDTPAPLGLDVYAAVTFLIETAATTALLWFAGDLAALPKALIVAALILPLVSWGGLFEAKAWAVPFEWARLALSVALIGWLARDTAFFAPITAASAAASLGLALWVARYRARRPLLAPAVERAAA